MNSMHGDAGGKRVSGIQVENEVDGAGVGKEIRI